MLLHRLPTQRTHSFHLSALPSKLLYQVRETNEHKYNQQFLEIQLFRIVLLQINHLV